MLPAIGWITSVAKSSERGEVFSTFTLMYWIVCDGIQLIVAFVFPALGEIVAPGGGLTRDQVTFVGEPVRLIASVVELELQITVSEKANGPVPVDGIILICCPTSFRGNRSTKVRSNLFTGLR